MAETMTQLTPNSESQEVQEHNEGTVARPIEEQTA